MAKLNLSVDVPLTPEAAWEHASNLNELGDWLSLHEGWRSDIPAELTVGTKVVGVAVVKGLRNRVTWTVRKSEPPNEIALNILLAGMTLIFVLATATIPSFAAYAGGSIPIIVLVALFVTLIPTTIGGLLSAIGIAGMDRLVQRNVLAMSGRAVEAAGDVDLADVLVGVVADAVVAAHEQHGDVRQAGQGRGVVAGAADHVHVWQAQPGGGAGPGPVGVAGVARRRMRLAPLGLRPRNRRCRRRDSWDSPVPALRAKSHEPRRSCSEIPARSARSVRSHTLSRQPNTLAAHGHKPTAA